MEDHIYLGCFYSKEDFVKFMGNYPGFIHKQKVDKEEEYEADVKRKAEAKAKTKARFEANRKPPQLVKDGDREYIQGNDTRAPEEQIQERFLKDKAARAALTATRREATAEARAAYRRGKACCDAGSG